jgi:hypothetical protein
MLELREKGFIALSSIINKSEVDAVLSKIKNQISSYASEIGVEEGRYSYCTGRWSSPSKIVDCIDDGLNNLIQNKLEGIVGKKIKLQKSNIICKNKNVKEAVAFHQDISYSPKSPYHFSLWLTLNDVDSNTGALQFVEGSHKWQIQPAVDFWSPNYLSSKDTESFPKEDVKVINLKEGDAVIFDSRLWHGSLESRNGKDRYAYVTRWEIFGLDFANIPEIKPEKFGMWNCHDMTAKILRTALMKRQLDKSNLDFISLINICKEVIIQGDMEIGQFDKDKALRDLHNVKILHKAAMKHNAGDLTGKVYKNLWYSLLANLASENGCE